MCKDATTKQNDKTETQLAAGSEKRQGLSQQVQQIAELSALAQNWNSAPNDTTVSSIATDGKTSLYQDPALPYMPSETADVSHAAQELNDVANIMNDSADLIGDFSSMRIAGERLSSGEQVLLQAELKLANSAATFAADVVRESGDSFSSDNPVPATGGTTYQPTEAPTTCGSSATNPEATSPSTLPNGSSETVVSGNTSNSNPTTEVTAPPATLPGGIDTSGMSTGLTVPTDTIIPNPPATTVTPSESGSVSIQPVNSDTTDTTNAPPNGSTFIPAPIAGTAGSESTDGSGPTTETSAAGSSDGPVIGIDPTTAQPTSVAGLESMMGVNSHPDVPSTLSQLQYLGISNLRQDGAETPDEYAAGIKTLPVQAGPSYTSDQLQTYVDSLASSLQANPGSITAIEGPNEVNNWPVTFNGQTGPDAAIALQQALYTDVHANQTLQDAGVKVVLGTSLDWASTGNWGQFPANPLSPDYPGGQLADIMNAHPYPSDLTNPTNDLTNLNTAYGTYTDSQGNQVPIPTAGGFISETGAQESDPNFAQDSLEMWLQGAKNGQHVYLYELQTDTNRGETGWGLFDSNGDPTEAATATHNFTSFLNESADSTVPVGNINYSASGIDQSSGGTLMLSNGADTDDLILWNQAGGTSTVQLGGDHNVTGYDPVTGQTTNYGDVSQVSVSLSDPAVLRISAGN